MSNNFLASSAILLAVCSSSLSANAINIINKDNIKAVGHVKWHMQAEVTPEALITKNIPIDSVSLFFIRAADNDSEQTSANIAINDRYQVSLQPGSYTQVYSCAGVNRLSAEVTGSKTNDLLSNTVDVTLEPNNHYFFYVDVNDKSKATIRKIESTQALKHLADKRYQTHQISRVVPNCPVLVAEPTLPVAIPAPVLETPVHIELEVLFDNDKAIVKPEYYGKVQTVADFMNQYSNTSVTIEGHTDSNASAHYNQQLSERRANAIKHILVTEFGIAENRLSAIGYGEKHPRATNKTAAGRQLNRRVIAVIQERN